MSQSCLVPAVSDKCQRAGNSLIGPFFCGGYVQRFWTAFRCNVWTGLCVLRISFGQGFVRWQPCSGRVLLTGDHVAAGLCALGWGGTVQTPWQTTLPVHKVPVVSSKALYRPHRTTLPAHTAILARASVFGNVPSASMTSWAVSDVWPARGRHRFTHSAKGPVSCEFPLKTAVARTPRNEFREI